MKISIMFLFFFMQIFVTYAQNKKVPTLQIKKTDKNLVSITDSLYAYKFECSNLDYRIFLNDLQNQNRMNEYAKYEVDSLQWRNPISYNEPYVFYYHRHQAYSDYPVVNITHDAASAYCRWLTEKYNSTKNRKFRKVIFKLPSATEWVLAANDGDPEKQKRFPVAENGGMFLTGRNGKMLANYSSPDDGDFIKDSTGKNIIYSLRDLAGVAGNGYLPNAMFYTSAINSFDPTKTGLYNMAGNVAEMLEEPGRTKGGSWNSLGGYLRINGPDEYKGFTHGQTQIGFRVFMKVIEK